MEKKILIVIEPIMRGSRVHILVYFLKSMEQFYDKIFVITRTDYYDGLLNEMTKRYNVVNVEYVPVVNMNGAWMRKLNFKEFLLIKNTIYKLIKDLPSSYKKDVFFAAIDDYFEPFLVSSFFLKRKEFDKCFFTRYRVFYNAKSLKDKTKQIFVLLSLFYFLFAKKMVMFNFDERIENKKNIFKLVNRNIITLPDPWDGDYGSVDKFIARQWLGIPQDSFVVTLIGRQNARKGFSFILKNIEKILGIDNLVLLISGKVEMKEEEKKLLELIEIYKKKIFYISRYLSEAEIVYSYASSDVILLPYSFDFSFSSGVLVRACASGVPVIASSHGLVGERVRRYNLGIVFEYGNEEELIKSIKKLATNSALLNEYRVNCYKYRANTSFEQFKRIIVNRLQSNKC